MRTAIQYNGARSTVTYVHVDVDAVVSLVERLLRERLHYEFEGELRLAGLQNTNTFV